MHYLAIISNRNHPFADGNKRTGTVSALAFLALNGYDFEAPEDVLAETVIEGASNKLDKSGLALFMQKWVSH